MDKMTLKQIIENYDKTGVMPVPVSGYSAEDMHLYQRAHELIGIIESVENSLKEKFAEYGELKITITKTDGLNKPICDAMEIDVIKDESTSKTNIDLFANFNLSRLAELPGPEVYAAVYYPLYDTILKNVEKKKESSSEEGKLVKDGGDNQQSTGKADSVVVTYLKEFLKNLLGLETEVDEFTVKSIATEFGNNGISKQDLFENPNGANLFAERFSKVSKQGHQQQATALLGEFSKSEFNSIRTGSDAEIMAFCEKFANNFLQNSGLEVGTYEINFSNTGDLGTYTDKGVNGQSITINIEAIRKMKNPAEVLMTLAHELTHMVDSSANKAIGKVSRRGMGLSEHNLVGGVDENSTGFLRRMEDIYYKANPHERSARRGELVALEFMMGMQPDETMKAHIKKSLESFQNYQIKTIQTLQSQVGPLIEEYNRTRNSLGYDEKTMAYIDRVMEDLKKMQAEGVLNFDKDLQALRASQGIGQAHQVENATALGE